MIEYKKPIYFSQKDPKWGSVMFSSHGNSKQTIASSGCGATSFAMVLSEVVGEAHYPPEIAKVIVDNGYRTYNNGVDWGFFKYAAQKYALKFVQTSSVTEVIKALKNGALIVASMGPGYFTSFGHFITLWGLDESNKVILCHDPNSTVRTKASYDLFKREGVNYFIFYRRGEEMAKKMVNEPDQKWKIEAGKLAIDGLATKKLLNNPELHKKDLEKITVESMDWLNLVLLDRIADRAGIKG